MPNQIQDKPITQRVCKCCQELKPIGQFYKTTNNGYRHRCKKCETMRRSTYFKDYHAKNYKPKGTKGRGRPRKTLKQEPQPEQAINNKKII